MAMGIKYVPVKYEHALDNSFEFITLKPEDHD